MKKLLFAAAAASIGSSALAASLGEPVFALPKMRTAPVVDGTIGADEWKDATKALQFIPLRGDVAFPGEAQVWFGRDDERFYIAARMIVSPHGLVRGPDPVKRRGNGGDLKAFSGDCFEFDFTSDKDAQKETVSHIIVSSVGAYYSTGTENGLPVSWDPPNFKTASRVVDGHWEFEFSIPLSEVKFKAADAARHGVRIARDWKFLNSSGFGIQSSIAPFETSFEKAGACCRMPFDDDAPVVKHEDLGISGHGGGRQFESYPVKLTVSNIGAKPMDVKVKILGKPVNSQPVLVEMPATVGPGETKDFAANGAVLSDELVDLQLLVTSADGVKTYYSRQFRFMPNFEAIAWLPHDSKGPTTVFRHAYYPSQDKMRVQASFPGDKKNARGARVAFSILDAKGNVLSRSDVRADGDGVADAVIPTGDLAAATRASGCGDYRVVMAAAGVKDGVRTNVFWRNVFEWEGNKIGLSDTVPAPFKPVERVRDATTGEERVKTILREHTVGDFGLWKQVCAVGKDLLAAPIALESEAAFDRARVATASEWDVDGMMKWTLTLKKGLKLAAPLRLAIPVKGERAPLMHSCTDGIRISYAGAVPKGEGVVWRSSQVPHVGIIGDYVPYIWVGGPLRGVSVFGDNDKGWVTADGVNHQEIVRGKDGTVRILLNLVQKPVEIDEDRTIVLGFQATPTKPMQDGWRSKSLGIFFGSGKCWGCGQTDSDVCPWDGTDEFWRKMRETMETGKIDEEFLKRTDKAYTYGGKPGSKEQAWWRERVMRHFRSGMQNCVNGRTTATYTWYTNARGVDFSTKQGQTFCDEWNRQEWMPHTFNILSHRDYDLDPCASFRDYAAWWYAKATKLGVCDNYYWDDIYLCPNYNLAGTDAYRLEDGTIQPSTGLFNMRALIRRCAMVQAECGRTRPNLNWLHMTSTAMAPILSFGGVNYDLEDGGSVNDFQDRYGRDYMLACTIGRQHGNIVSVMGYFGKTTPEERTRLQRCGTGVMLVHELIWRLCPTWRTFNEKLRAWGYRTSDVDVWNDWDEDVPFPVALSGEPVAAIALRNNRSGEVLVIVSDWANGGVAKIAPDAATLGLGESFKAFDFETGDEIPVSAGAVEARLVRHDFKIVRFVATKRPRAPAGQTCEQAVDAAWKRVMTGLWDSGTACIYDYISSNRFGEVSYKACMPTPEEMALQFPNPNGWRMGLEDCDLKGGPMLVAALRRLEAHGGNDDEACATIDKVYRGLRTCATISGIPGFVARGVSPIDGKSFYSNSSRDQYTLFIYAMWRYYRSGFADETRKAEIRGMLTDIARMLTRIMADPKAEMSLPRADGKPGDIGYMWVKKPRRVVRVEEDSRFVRFDGLMCSHEAFRLPMFFAAAWDVSGDATWRTEQLKYMNDAFFMTGPDFVPYGFDLPAFALYQAQVSHRLLWELEPNAKTKAALADVMRRFAKMADRTFDGVEKRLAEISDNDLYAPAADWRRCKFIYRSGRCGGQPPGELISGLPYMIPELPNYWKAQCIPELLGLSLLTRMMVPGKDALPATEIHRFRRIAASVDWSRHCMSSMTQMILAHWALESASVRK